MVSIKAKCVRRSFTTKILRLTQFHRRRPSNDKKGPQRVFLLSDERKVDQLK